MKEDPILREIDSILDYADDTLRHAKRNATDLRNISANAKYKFRQYNSLFTASISQMRRVLSSIKDYQTNVTVPVAKFRKILLHIKDKLPESNANDNSDNVGSIMNKYKTIYDATLSRIESFLIKLENAPQNNNYKKISGGGTRKTRRRGFRTRKSHYR